MNPGIVVVTVQSWLYGKVLAVFAPDAFALHASRGHQSPFSKLLLRWSVVASDFLSERLLSP